LTKEFEKIIIQETLGGLTTAELDSLFSLFENEFKNKPALKSIEANLIRLFKAVFSLPQFLRECIRYPHFVPVIVNIVSNSNYLTDILVRDPEYLYWILTSKPQNERLDLNEINSEIRKRFENNKNFNSRIKLLKSIKRREILRIGFRDLTGLDSLRESASQLSFLAHALLSNLFEICFDKKAEDYLKISPMTDMIPDLHRNYAVIALGKMGGEELNYSSDVDLIAFYSDEESLTQNSQRKGSTKNSKKKENNVVYAEFLAGVIQLFIKEATAVNEDGFLYRIDFRLRPHGKDAPLCKSLAETINYYEFEGEEWERQMLIKASFLCGSKNLYQGFSSFITSFIFANRGLSSPVEQILRLRRVTINKEKDDWDIKQSQGGLRDIEFPVQALQLINGCHNKKIRSGNTLDAIERMSQSKIISNKEKVAVSEAYVFFRRVEHYLQLMNDNMTHKIPESGIILEKISAYFGFKNVTSFLKEIGKYKKLVVAFANSVYLKEGNASLKNSLPQLSDPGLSFSSIPLFNRSFEFLREGKGRLGRKMNDPRMMESFARIEPMLNEFLDGAIDPEMTLRNFVRVIKSANFPSIWYDLFRDEKVFHFFLRLCEKSQRSIDLFSENKKLRDFFISGTVFNPITEMSFSAFAPDEILFFVLAQFTNGMITGSQTGKIISDYLKFRIKSYFGIRKSKGEILVLALGSFSTGEMSFSSDIDLFFLATGKGFTPETQEEYIKVLNDIRKLVDPFKVDSRLRPEGESGSLVWSLSSFNDYLIKRARTWEFQSYTRMNLIHGDLKSYKLLMKNIIAASTAQESESTIKNAKVLLEKSYSTGSMFNIKNSRGGLRDSEYLAQILLLLNGAMFEEFVGKPVSEILEKAGKYFPGYQDESTILLNNRKFLIDLQLAFQNFSGGSGSALPTDSNKLELIAKATGMPDKESLLKKIETVRKENTGIIKKLFEVRNWIEN